ncbi:MAG: YetF domain-containing protein [Saprospiraceae bacterium]
MSYDYFFKDLDRVPETLIGVFLIYIVIILYTRIFGLKSFSKMTSYDFAKTIAIGSLIASSVIAGTPSFVLGAVAIGGLYFFNYLFSWLRLRSDRLEQLLDNSPVYLIKDGEILYGNLNSTKVTEGELIAKLREANVLRMSQVKAVVLETTGDVSVLHSADGTQVEDFLVKDVRREPTRSY